MLVADAGFRDLRGGDPNHGRVLHRLTLPSAAIALAAPAGPGSWSRLDQRSAWALLRDGTVVRLDVDPTPGIGASFAATSIDARLAAATTLAVVAEDRLVLGTADGTVLAVSPSEQRTLSMTDVAREVPGGGAIDGAAAVRGLSASPTGDRLAAITADGDVVRVDAARGDVVTADGRFTPERAARCVAVSDGGAIVIGDEAGRLVFLGADMQPHGTITVSGRPLVAVRWSIGGGVVAVDADQRTIVLEAFGDPSGG